VEALFKSEDCSAGLGVFLRYATKPANAAGYLRGVPLHERCISHRVSVGSSDSSLNLTLHLGAATNARAQMHAHLYRAVVKHDDGDVHLSLERFSAADLALRCDL